MRTKLMQLVVLALAWIALSLHAKELVFPADPQEAARLTAVFNEHCKNKIPPIVPVFIRDVRDGTITGAHKTVIMYYEHQCLHPTPLPPPPKPLPKEPTKVPVKKHPSTKKEHDHA